MKIETKLVAVAGVLPVLADFIEDLNDHNIFTRSIKMRANMLLEEIRKADNRLLSGADDNIINQQMDIQLAFRQWIQSAENEI